MKKMVLHRYPSLLDIGQLVEECLKFPTSTDAGNVDMAFLQGAGIPESIPAYLRAAVEEIAALSKMGKPTNLMINTMQSRTVSPVHRDWIDSPMQGKNACIARFHLPVQVNLYSCWWDECNGMVPFVLGEWIGPMPYWLNHQVLNSGLHPRINLIVDIDLPEPIGEYNDS